LADFINYPLQFSWRFISLEPVCKERTNAVSQEGAFSVIQGEVDGRPLVAMIDMGLREMPDKQGLSFFLSLSTSLIGPTSEGLPTRSDADNLNI